MVIAGVKMLNLSTTLELGKKWLNNGANTNAEKYHLLP